MYEPKWTGCRHIESPSRRDLHYDAIIIAVLVVIQTAISSQPILRCVPNYRIVPAKIASVGWGTR